MSSGDAQWVKQDGDAVAFLPLPEGSLAPGHTLVVPRAHCVGVQDADPQALHASIDLVQRLSLAMSSALGATGVVVLNASGAHSGQSVNHLHFHVVPCWADDEATFWPSDRSVHSVAGEPRTLLAEALS
jgi:histidine triad (HIT) family protein